MRIAIIKPVSYLRNNFADVSAMAHENVEPVYLSKNSYDDMVNEYGNIIPHL